MKSQSLSDDVIGRISLPRNKNLRHEWGFWDTPFDSRERWINYMKDPDIRNYLIQQGWDREDSITYDINSHGFRDSEFIAPRDIIALGCSFTKGTGLRDQQIWPYLVGSLTGMTIANLGSGGASAGTCFRFLHYWIGKLNPKIVVCLLPFAHRLELLDFDPYFHSKRYTVIDNDIKDEYLKRYWSTDYNSLLDRERNTLAMQYLCLTHNARLILYNAEDFNSINGDRARDMSHPGPLYQQRFANMVAKDITGATQIGQE